MGDRLATIDMGRKVMAAVPPFRGGADGFPSNTMSHGPRPTSVQTGILIYPTVWSHQRYSTDRPDKQANGSVA